MLTDLQDQRFKKYLYFFPIYIAGYILVERIPMIQNYHVVQCALDGEIPFSEAFVLAYLAWHAEILVLVIYTFTHDRERFERILRYFILCSVICFLAFLIFPSMQNLRPESFPRDNIFSRICGIIYTLDTNTNTCPSMHVIGAVGMYLIECELEPLKNRLGKSLSLGLCILICLSTVCIKQHSIIDVILSAPVCFIGWWTCLSDQAEFNNQELKSFVRKLFAKGKVFTIPNILTAARLCLIPVIVRCYKSGNYYLAAELVIISGITDVLDGFIARNFNMVSDLGKIIDPIADKSTQLAMIYCLTIRYPKMWILVFFICAKELIQAVFGYMTLRKENVVNSSQWFGKLSTVMLYTMSFLLFLFPDIPENYAHIMIAINMAFLALSLVLYSRFYIRTYYADKIAGIFRRSFRALGFCMWAAVIILVLIYKDELTAETLASWAPQNLFVAAALLLFAYALKSITIVFYSGILYAAGGLLFSTPFAILINLLGMVIMVSLPYLYGRKYGYAQLDQLVQKNPKLKLIEAGNIDKGFKFTCLIRLLQFLNYDIGSYYLGAVGVSYGKALAGSIVIMLPQMIFFTLIGVNTINTSLWVPAGLVIYWIGTTAVSVYLLKHSERA